MMAYIYIPQDRKQIPGTLTPVEEKVSDVDGTELTSNFIMEQLTPFILQNLNNMIDEKFNLLYEQIEKLNEQINKLKPEVSEEEAKIVYIREIDKNEAKKEIKQYFNTNDVDIYPSEISELLGIQYELVWEIIKELEEEGVIESGD